MDGSTPQKATLKDVISYEPDKYLSDEDVAVIKSNVKGNKKFIKALRKVFLPTLSDAELPVEDFGKDMWFAGVDFSQLSRDEIQQRVIARMESIKFVMQGLIWLQQIAHMTEETPMEAALRRSQDSNK